MVFAASAMQYFKGSRGKGPFALGVIALLAFSSGAQVAMARAMQMPEIPTAMATTAWVDLVMDPEILARRNRSRNRRALFLFALIAGSFVGAFAYGRVGPAFPLLMAAVGKTIVTAVFLLNRTESGVRREDVEGRQWLGN
jgi:uncharacterized membrane protein YoaK (UPF0700 family)